MNSEMDNKNWLNDYMSLKQVNPANPFTVPAGYFDDLEAHIIALKNIEDFKIANNQEGFTVPEGYFDDLANNIQSRIAVETAVNAEDTGFAVPENYFDKLSSNIQSRITIETAVNAEDAGFSVPGGYFNKLSCNIQSRIAIENAVNAEDAGFGVPEGYFNELSSNIQSRIAIETAVNAGDTGFAVPESYFEELAGNIQSKIAIEELLGSPEQPFAVPAGYFEKLNNSILKETVNIGGNIKRKAIVRRLVTSTAFKYATAACFAIAIGGGILISEISNPVNEHNNSFLHKQLLNVPTSEIKSYLQLNVDAGDTQQTVATQGTQVNDADLKNALKNYVDSVQ